MTDQEKQIASLRLQLQKANQMISALCQADCCCEGKTAHVESQAFVNSGSFGKLF